MLSIMWISFIDVAVTELFIRGASVNCGRRREGDSIGDIFDVQATEGEPTVGCVYSSVPGVFKQ